MEPTQGHHSRCANHAPFGSPLCFALRPWVALERAWGHRGDLTICQIFRISFFHSNAAPKEALIISRMPCLGTVRCVEGAVQNICFFNKAYASGWGHHNQQLKRKQALARTVSLRLQMADRGGFSLSRSRGPQRLSFWTARPVFALVGLNSVLASPASMFSCRNNSPWSRALGSE
jgi:hypothetical protein